MQLMQLLKYLDYKNASFEHRERPDFIAIGQITAETFISSANPSDCRSDIDILRVELIASWKNI